MSNETLTWLNSNTLIGFTDKRGTAWHYRAADQGGESNHYPGAVPVSDVQRRLFNWTAEEQPLFIPNGEGFTLVEGRKAIVRSDTRDVMGIFKDGYQPHDYNEWLLHTVGDLIDDDLAIGSAGLLKGGAVAWVSVEVPDTITTAEGVSFRPNLLATTSFDGSLATTFKRVVTNTVCDNTMAVALGENGQAFKVRHSRNSRVRLSNARDALNIVHTVADDFMQEVKELCDQELTDLQFEELIDKITPLPEIKEGSSTRGLTLAENKRDTLWRMWRKDERVAPWSGTVFGAWQALNTYAHHESNVRGMERAERNMLNAVTGKTESADADNLGVIKTLVSA